MVILTGKPLLFFCLNIIYIINVVIQAQDLEPNYYICGATTYTPNSRYDTNLDDAMSSLPNTNSGYGFYNISVGELEGPDTANAISLCRGDVDPATCRNCLNDSIIELRQRCPNQTEAIAYHDYCFLWYSNATILGNNNMNNHTLYSWKDFIDNNAIDFHWVLGPLLAELKGKAADGGLLKFDTGNRSLQDSSKVYALEQCIPDLSSQECNDCLQNLISQIPIPTSRRGRAMTSSCTIRYETYQFYNNENSVIRPPKSPPTLPSPPGKDTRTTQWMAIIIPVIFVILVILIGMFIIWRRKEKLAEEFKSEIMDISIVESLHYDFHTIKVATNDFSENKKLGQGGFGSVYEVYRKHNHKVIHHVPNDHLSIT